MRVNVIIHLELTDDAQLCWWAESPELPRTSVIGSTLPQILEELEDVLEEAALPEPPELVYSFAIDVTATETKKVASLDGGEPVGAAGESDARALVTIGG